MVVVAILTLIFVVCFGIYQLFILIKNKITDKKSDKRTIDDKINALHNEYKNSKRGE